MLKNQNKTRNNIIGKLAGTSWGSNTQVLHMSALALVYSTVEYCAAVWDRRVHCKNYMLQIRVVSIG